MRAYLQDLADRTWDVCVWLQHDTEAGELDAEIVLEATATYAPDVRARGPQAPAGIVATLP